MTPPDPPSIICPFQNLNQISFNEGEIIWLFVKTIYKKTNLIILKTFCPLNSNLAVPKSTLFPSFFAFVISQFSPPMEKCCVNEFDLQWFESKDFRSPLSEQLFLKLFGGFLWKLVTRVSFSQWLSFIWELPLLKVLFLL